jgi:hypothetical protein
MEQTKREAEAKNRASSKAIAGLPAQQAFAAAGNCGGAGAKGKNRGFKGLKGLALAMIENR